MRADAGLLLLPDGPAPWPVLPAWRAWALHGVAASRRLEATALASHAPHALMARAGLATARLALAVAPHARRVWVAAGPGNNGGDGLVAARWLHSWGKQVSVSLLGPPALLPADAQAAWQAAVAAGVPVQAGLPASLEADLCLDALLGLGARRAPEGAIAEAIRCLNGQTAPVLAIDLPSGLNADTGNRLGPDAVRATHTLSLLSLKPGLFTAEGRDLAGRVWLDTLGVQPQGEPATAWLGGRPASAARRHAQHKGSFGDVLVLGGADGMGGAAWLAGRAALAAGAGRVLVARLGGDPLAGDDHRPELMPRTPASVLQPDTLGRCTVVLGCGGGDAVEPLLAGVLQHAGRLVLDADGLNALARQPGLWPLLAARAGPTVLTPHPLEAARLLGCSAARVQADRLAAAQTLADRAQAVVLLKGSGTVVAAPGRVPVLNPTGNGRLGTAGSGDVLAGWLGAGLAARPLGAVGGRPETLEAARLAACDAAWLHGRAAEVGDLRLPLRAADLVEAMAAGLAELPMPPG